MNLDRMIRIKLIELSSKYDISLVEIQKPKDGKVSRVINFTYRPKDTSPIENECISFRNKKELVSWLVCLN